MLTEISIQNFGPIKQLDLNCKNKNVYIIGPNGTGKSHILRAIAFACTGKHGKSHSIEYLIGPYAKDFKITLVLDDGSKITRTSKTSLLELSDGRSFKKVAEVQEHLPFDPLLFYNAAFVKQGAIHEFFEKDVGKGIVEKLISLVIDTKTINDGYKELLTREKIYVAEVKNKEAILADISSTQPINLVELQQEIHDLESQMCHKPDITKITTEENKHKQLSQAMNSLDMYRNQLAQLNMVSKPIVQFSELETKQKQYQLKEQYLQKRNQHEEDVKKYVDALTVVDELRIFFGLDTTLVKATYTEEQLRDLNVQKKTLYTYLTTEQYTDMNNANTLLSFNKQYGHIDAQSIAQEKAKYSSIKDKLQTHASVIQHLKQFVPFSKDVSEILKDIINKYTQDINNIDIQIQQLGVVEDVSPQRLNEVAIHWSNYNNYVTHLNQYTTHIESLEKQITEISNSIEMTEEEIHVSKQMIHNYQTVAMSLKTKKDLLEMYTKNLKKKETTEKEIEVASNILNDILSWKETFKDMPGKLRTSLFKPVAYHLNHDFQELFSFDLGAIKMDWDNFDIQIGDRIFDQMSGAQTVCLGLTSHLALLKAMGNKVPIMLIDEPTQFLDDTRINEVKQYLTHLGKQTQLFICTHDDNIIDSVNSIIINPIDFN